LRPRRRLRRRFLLRRCRRGAHDGFGAAAATATTTATAAARALAIGSRGLRLLGCGCSLQRRLRTRLALLAAGTASGLLPVAVASALAASRRALRLRLAATARLVFLRAADAEALLELLHLALHELAGLLLRARAGRVVPAVGAALPPFGERFLAVGAENAFRQRHVEIGAHCTLRAVTSDRAVPPPSADREERRKTLRTLIDLAGAHNPSDCWDDERAADLLRSQSTADELRELGASDAIIAHIFGETARG
jgi:hypothetical protein